MKSKLITIMFIILGAITLIGATAFVVFTKFAADDEHKEPTIDEVIASTVEVPEITTKLLSNDYLRISFNIQTNSEKAKEELEKRQFQVKNLIIKELSDMKSEEFKGEAGIASLESQLEGRINELMQEGKVVKVYATSFLPQ